MNGRIACFLPTLSGGGAERAALKLADGIQKRGHPVDLILVHADGPLREEVPPDVRLIDLKQPRNVQAIGPLAHYMRTERPSGVIAHMNYANLTAIAARKRAGLALPLICVEHNHFTAMPRVRLRERSLPWLMKRFYPAADAIVSVSNGVGRDLESALGLPLQSVQTIYNPTVDAMLLAQAEEPLEHPWFVSGQPPVLLAVGRLNPQKDFPNLLRAFSIVRGERDIRLVILGEGPERTRLETLIRSLELQKVVDLPGFLPNPYRFMKRSSALILSSLHEGLPTVLIEAMACGCPVASTDCPSGPREILDEERYGLLVPIQNPEALAKAILQTLAAPTPSRLLRERSQAFSFEAATTNYLKLMECLVQRYSSSGNVL